MKKVKLATIATIIATFVISIFSFQPTTTEKSNGVVPTATPTPRIKRAARKTQWNDWNGLDPIIRRKTKRATPYNVGKDDGSRIRRKQPRKKRHSNQTTAR